MSSNEQTAPDQGRFFGISGWVTGVALLGLGALSFAANAGEGAAYYDGLVFSALAVVVIFLIIKRHYDRSDGIAGTGVLLCVRVAVALAVGYLVYGPAPEVSVVKARIMALLAGGAVFVLLSVLHWVLVTTR